MISLDVSYLDTLLAIFLKNLKKSNDEDYEPVTVLGYNHSIGQYLSEDMSPVHMDNSLPTSKAALSVKKRT